MSTHRRLEVEGYKVEVKNLR